MRVSQRLVFEGTGDYVFAVGAPAFAVEAAPGSRSEPGFRADTILWQGFSPGRRELTAIAHLRLADSSPALPLRLALRGGELILENATAVRVETFDGKAQPREVEGALRALRRAAATGARSADVDLRAAAVRPRTVRAEAPLAIEGELDGRQFAAVLGGGRPSRLVVHARPSARPRLRVEVRPVLPADALAGPPTLATAVVASLRFSRVRQYDSFLANPDRFGSSETVYEYRFEPARAVAPASGSSDPNGWSPLQVLALVASGVVALGGLLALWARF